MNSRNQPSTLGNITPPLRCGKSRVRSDGLACSLVDGPPNQMTGMVHPGLGHSGCYDVDRKTKGVCPDGGGCKTKRPSGPPTLLHQSEDGTKVPQAGLGFPVLPPGPLPWWQPEITCWRTLHSASNKTWVSCPLAGTCTMDRADLQPMCILH